MNSNLPAIPPPGPPEFRAPGPLVNDDQKLELLEYWRSVTKRKWAILALVAVAAIIATIVAYAMTPIFKSTVTILIEGGRPKIVSIEDIYTMGPGQSREAFLTQVEVIKSRDVVERAVIKEKLWDHPAYDPRKVPDSWRKRLRGVWGEAAAPVVWDEEKLKGFSLARAQAAMTVEAVGYSQLIRVSFESPDNELAARMANAIAEGYIQSQRDVRANASQQANATLLDSLGELKKKLFDSERALQQYRESKGLVSLGGSTQTLATQQATATTTSLQAARVRRIELEGSYKQLGSVQGGDYTTVPWVMRDPTVQDTVKQLNDARRKLTELSQTLGSRNNKVIEALALVDSLDATLKKQTAAAAEALRREYLAAASTEQSMQRDLNAVRETVKDGNRDEFQLASLEREVQANRQLYDLFVTRAKETNLAGEVQAAVARIVERAVPSVGPIKPVKERIIGLAVAAAALLGAAIGLLLDALDNTVKGQDDAERRLRLPLLSALPSMKQRNHSQMATIFLSSPESNFSEGVRTARTGVMLSTVDRPNKSILVTSTLPGEGKTTFAINLALAHAQTRRTLIIDADMRRPQVSKRLGLDPTVKGMTSLLAGELPLEECIQVAAGSTLEVLPVGTLPPNPLELLLSQRFQEVLRELELRYDIIIIDSPPVGLVSDSRVLGPKVTSTIMVVRAMSTPAPMVRKSITQMQQSGASMLGVVLNGLDFQRAAKYYGDLGAGYGYKYGEAYGAADSELLPYGYGERQGGKAARAGLKLESNA